MKITRLATAATAATAIGACALLAPSAAMAAPTTGAAHPQVKDLDDQAVGTYFNITNNTDHTVIGMEGYNGSGWGDYIEFIDSHGKHATQRPVLAPGQTETVYVAFEFDRGVTDFNDESADIDLLNGDTGQDDGTIHLQGHKDQTSIDKFYWVRWTTDFEGQGDQKIESQHHVNHETMVADESLFSDRLSPAQAVELNSKSAR